MTPMGTAFMEIEDFFEAPAPEMWRSEWINLLHRFVRHARDTEETGLAVTFAAAGVIYMDTFSEGERPSPRPYRDWLSTETRKLRASIEFREHHLPGPHTGALRLPQPEVWIA